MDKNDEKYLIKSLQLERYAIKRYTKQHEEIIDPNVNKLIGGFLRNVINHERYILEFLGPKAGDVPANGFGVQEIVSQKFTGGLRTLMGFLTLDLEFEKTAVKIYSESYSSVKDKKIKKFFQETIKAETGHINSLSRALKQMEKGEWSLSFYCPVCGDEIRFKSVSSPIKSEKCRSCYTEFKLKKENEDYFIGEVKPFC